MIQPEFETFIPKKYFSHGMCFRTFLLSQGHLYSSREPTPSLDFLLIRTYSTHAQTHTQIQYTHKHAHSPGLWEAQIHLTTHCHKATLQPGAV